jgi:hypothetical protein
MATKLSSKTKIMELATQFPFLFDTLVEISPKLKKLKNPILQKTIGKKASLMDVSKIAKITLNLLFQKLSEAITQKSGESVEIDKDAKEEGEWQEEMERRQEQMKQLILDLHKGEKVENLQSKFKGIITDVTAGEVAEMEQSLISWEN